ncbi:agamous-like MADS-box protein MADS9 isoform X2 [Punica granatum]|uniref:Agamous-like MADS-box protein MADS9 isoform X2 n=1 Tax=Punica granatum TaxID=22663 RepID=A0A6P8BMK6_PUNGR|nr:agamous-like MADS-box protein MADS9 isoform X2 [Punica granatum]
MGRGKIEIKRIENSSNRQVTYSKRRNGIIKKAKEITVLCDAKVSLIIYASSGKMHEYCSPSTTLVDILEHYHRLSGKRLWDAKHENLSNEVDRVKKENDSLQIKLRHLKGEDITSLTHRELIALEDALEQGLTCVRHQQSEIVKTHRRNTKMLEEENKELNYILQQQQREMAMAAENVKEAEYYQRLRDYHSQGPFAFRVQPFQPNLQDHM